MSRKRLFVLASGIRENTEAFNLNKIKSFWNITISERLEEMEVLSKSKRVFLPFFLNGKIDAIRWLNRWISVVFIRFEPMELFHVCWWFVAYTDKNVSNLLYVIL